MDELGFGGSGVVVEKDIGQIRFLGDRYDLFVEPGEAVVIILLGNEGHVFRRDPDGKPREFGLPCKVEVKTRRIHQGLGGRVYRAYRQKTCALSDFPLDLGLVRGLGRIDQRTVRGKTGQRDADLAFDLGAVDRVREDRVRHQPLGNVLDVGEHVERVEGRDLWGQIGVLARGEA